MKTHLSGTPKFGLFFAVAFLALQATPAAPADSAGSGTYVGAQGSVRASVTFKDVYAFRAEDRSDKTKQVTVVLLSESPLDKKAMTTALKQKPNWTTIEPFGNYLDGMAYAEFVIDKDGKIMRWHFYKPPGYNHNLPSGMGKSDVKVNTAKRVEGRFSVDETNSKIDLRFATDLAEIGTPVKY